MGTGEVDSVFITVFMVLKPCQSARSGVSQMKVDVKMLTTLSSLGFVGVSVHSNVNSEDAAHVYVYSCRQ